MRLNALIALIVIAATNLELSDAALSQERPITQRIVRLTTSDGLSIDGVLMHPNSGINIGAPAIVFHHGGPAGHAARSIGAYRFAAERLATAGYTVLSPVSRQSSGYYQYVLDDAIKDIDASVDFVSAFGFDRIILAGHSMGSIRITRHQIIRENPLVKAMVHFAPTADIYEFSGSKPEMVPILTAAQRAMAQGRGKLGLHPDSIDPDTSLTPPAMGASARGRLQTPEALLSWWGPGFPTANSDFFPLLTVPQLLLAGTEDFANLPGRLERLKELAVNSPRVDYKWYEGGDHYFTGKQDESSADMIKWLEELGLGPGRAVTTKLADTPLNVTFTEGGQRVPYPGVAYVPEGINRSTSPLIIYLYGLGEQIFEDPLHRLGTLMAHRGYEGLAPQLRDSGFRGSLTSIIAKSAEDIADVVNTHRLGNRPIVFVGQREGILWAFSSVKNHEIQNVIGFVSLAPPPDLPEYAKEALDDDRYDKVVSIAEQLLADKDSSSFIVEKYFRPEPALAGSTDAFMVYPETFLDYFGPDSNAKFSDYASNAKSPVLMVTGSNDTMLGTSSLRKMSRLTRSSRISHITIDGAGDLFKGYEAQAADNIADWLEEIAN